MFLKVVWISICSEISYDKKCENCDNLGLEIKILPIFPLYQKILKRFVSFCISLIFMYCLFVEKELVTIEISLLDFSAGQKCVTKWQFLLIFLKRVEKDPFFKASNQSQGYFQLMGFRILSVDGYCIFSQVLHTLTGTEDMTHGYCISSPVLRI